MATRSSASASDSECLPSSSSIRFSSKEIEFIEGELAMIENLIQTDLDEMTSAFENEVVGVEAKVKVLQDYAKYLEDFLRRVEAENEIQNQNQNENQAICSNSNLNSSILENEEKSIVALLKEEINNSNNSKNTDMTAAVAVPKLDLDQNLIVKTGFKSLIETVSRAFDETDGCSIIEPAKEKSPLPTKTIATMKRGADSISNSNLNFEEFNFHADSKSPPASASASPTIKTEIPKSNVQKELGGGGDGKELNGGHQVEESVTYGTRRSGHRSSSSNLKRRSLFRDESSSPSTSTSPPGLPYRFDMASVRIGLDTSPSLSEVIEESAKPQPKNNNGEREPESESESQPTKIKIQELESSEALSTSNRDLEVSLDFGPSSLRRDRQKQLVRFSTVQMRDSSAGAPSVLLLQGYFDFEIHGKTVPIRLVIFHSRKTPDSIAFSLCFPKEEPSNTDNSNEDRIREIDSSYYGNYDVTMDILDHKGSILTAKNFKVLAENGSCCLGNEDITTHNSECQSPTYDTANLLTPEEILLFDTNCLTIKRKRPYKTITLHAYIDFRLLND